MTSDETDPGEGRGRSRMAVGDAGTLATPARKRRMDEGGRTMDPQTRLGARAEQCDDHHRVSAQRRAEVGAKAHPSDSDRRALAGPDDDRGVGPESGEDRGVRPLARALRAALAREARGRGRATEATRGAAQLEQWAERADAELAHWVRETRLSAKEGKRMGWRWNTATPWSGAWRTAMEWGAAHRCGLDPQTWEIADEALYEHAKSGLAEVAREVGDAAERGLEALGGAQWKQRLWRALEEVERAGCAQGRYRWRTADLMNLMAMRPARRARVLAEPPWLAERLAASQNLRRVRATRWKAVAAAQAGGAAQPYARATVARAQRSLERWRTRENAPPLRTVWQCAREGVEIVSHAQWAAAVEAERAGAAARESAQAVRTAGAGAGTVEEGLRRSACAKVAAALGVSEDEAGAVLADMESRWGELAEEECALTWQGEGAPLWRVPYTSARAVIAGTGWGTRARSKEAMSRGRVMNEIRMFSGMVLTLDGEGLVRKRQRRKPLEVHEKCRVHAALQALAG